MLLFISLPPLCVCPVPSFQNISCYCLSAAQFLQRYDTVISKHLMLLFIENQIDYEVVAWNFKTSHVIVYQLDREKESIKREHFKTSHVIVYRHLAIHLRLF